jgi:hypothetical protein
VLLNTLLPIERIVAPLAFSAIALFAIVVRSMFAGCSSNIDGAAAIAGDNRLGDVCEGVAGQERQVRIDALPKARETGHSDDWNAGYDTSQRASSSWRGTA